MSRDDALRRALTLPPDIPGVGRLCQELLADITGRRVTVPVAPIEKLIHGNAGKPWSASRRAAYERTIAARRK